MKELGVPHHEFLGYVDSGMMGTLENDAENSFWRADFMEATARLVGLIRRHRPEVMTAYDPYGGYGHPDHIQVHRVGTAAFFGAGDTARFPPEDGDEPWTPSKLYWATFPRSAVMAMIQARLEAGEITEEEAVEPGAGSLDADINVWIDSPGFAEHKERAVLAHHSQIPPDSWFRTLRQDEKLGFLGREPFTRVFSRVAVPDQEDDLFAGLR